MSEVMYSLSWRFCVWDLADNVYHIIQAMYEPGKWKKKGNKLHESCSKIFQVYFNSLLQISLNHGHISALNSLMLPSRITVSLT